MNLETTDLQLIDLIKKEKNEVALKELIQRHSGIYFDMAKRFGSKNLSLDDFNEILEERDYNIYKAAIDYDKERAKFSTYLATKVKFICLTKRTRAKNNKEKISYEEVDFLFSDQDNSPYEKLIFKESIYKILVEMLEKEDAKIKDIFLHRYFYGDLNKLKPWWKVGKSLGLSSQGCINIHNKTISKIQKRINNESIKF